MANSTRSDKKLQTAKQQAQERRRARLAAELRANLLKRKEQARGRAVRDVAGDGPGEPLQPESGPEAGEPQDGPPGKTA